MTRTTLLLLLGLLTHQAASAQWASYRDMIRREARATAEHVARMSEYYNKPSGSSGVFANQLAADREQREAERAKRTAEHRRIQAALEKKDKEAAARSDERLKPWLADYRRFLAVADPALVHLKATYPLNSSEIANFTKANLMQADRLSPDFVQASRVLDDYVRLRNDLASLSVEEARAALERVALIRGLENYRLLELALRIEAKAPNETVDNDEMLFNAFRVYYADRYFGGTQAEQEAYVARFEKLAERYPEFTLDFIRQQLRENPYEHKIKVIIASDQSERKKKAALEVAFAQQRDVQKGIIGYSAALKSARTIIDLAARLDRSPAELMLDNPGDLKVTRLGNSLVGNVAYHPHFVFWKDLAATGDESSSRGYILHTYSARGGEKGAVEIVDFALSQAASGNLAVLKVALELLPQGIDGRRVLQERGPQGLKTLFEALARQRPAEEVAATRQAVSAWIEAIKLQDHPERNALLKRSLAEAV
jgi:hypothetical protein